MGRYMDDWISQKIRQMQMEDNVYQVGRVTAVKEYILEVEGLEEAAFMERVRIGERAVGYVSAIRRSFVMVAVVRE